MMSFSAHQTTPYPVIKPLPDNARNAIYDCLKLQGFSSNMIKEDYAFSGLHNQLIKVNALVFAHEIHRSPDYTGITVINPENSITEADLTQILAQTAAPFHFIFRENKQDFSFWFSNIKDRGTSKIESRQIETDISYTNLSKVLNTYAVDIKPQKIIDVKQGREEFNHLQFREIGPFQLSLWAIEVTSKLLVEHFGRVVNWLYTFRDKQSGLPIPEKDVTDIAIQLLGATILAHTGNLGDDIRSDDPSVDLLINKAFDKFPNYFNVDLFEKWNEAIFSAYKILKELRYSGFAPDMLKGLYTEAYPDRKTRKDLGRYDTPLFLTRRIWDTIPVEFLPPKNRIIADITCGWGSFLIAGYERLSRISDIRNGSLREYIHGNDTDPFTARLAALGLLISTLDDSWHVDNKDAMNWKWLEKRPNIIVGNPPFGGDRKIISGKEKRHQKADKFLDRAIDYLAPDGYLAMLMPQSFVAAEASPQLRKKLLNKCDLIELWELPFEMFPDVKANTIVIFAKKKYGLSRSKFPVRVRTLQQNTLNKFKESEVFTKSNIVTNQIYWDESSRRSRGSKNTHIMDYYLILPESSWKKIKSDCIELNKLAEIFPGATVGKKPAKKRWKDFPNPKKVKWLTGAKNVIKDSFSIDYNESKTITYPNELKEPIINKEQFLSGNKILLTANANPSWGKRVKVAIERKGYYVSDSFIIIVPTPTPEMPYITLEVVAAVLDWKVSNAWIVEHLKHPKIPSRIIKNIPFPFLSENDSKILTSAIHEIEESINNNMEYPILAANRIDSVLKAAYQLDDETFNRLNLISKWDTDPRITLDQIPDVNPTWKTSGIVDSIYVENGTITFWLTDYDELQTVPISPQMPGWLLRTDIAFRTTIPRDCLKQQNLKDVSWGNFYPQEYTYLNEKELIDELTNVFHPYQIES